MVCVLPGQMCDRGDTGVAEKGTETGDDEFKKTKQSRCASLVAQLPSGHLSRQHRPNGDKL